MSKKISKVLSLVLVLSLAAVMPVRALALDWNLNEGSITVDANDAGQYVTQNGASTEDSAPVIKSEGPTNNTVTITSSGDATAKVTMEDVGIIAENGNGVNITDGSTVDLTIEGEVVVTTQDQTSAAIHVGAGSDVTISGSEDAWLVAQTDMAIKYSEDEPWTVVPGSGAGIGSNKGEDMSSKVAFQGGLNAGGVSTNGTGFGAGEGGTMSGSLTFENGGVVAYKMQLDENGEPVPIDGVIGTNGGTSTGTITIGENTTINGVSGSEAEKFIDSSSASADSPTQYSEPVAAPVVIAQSGEYYTVATEHGGWLKHTSQTENGVLTVTVDAENAVFSANRVVLLGLRAQGIEKVVLVSASATSSFQLADVLAAMDTGRLVLTHMGASATLTLNGQENNALLK